MHNPEPGDLIENTDYPLWHAESLLLAEESRTDFALEFKCANGNRWPYPEHAINHGNVVEAYRKLREATNPQP